MARIRRRRRSGARQAIAWLTAALAIALATWEAMRLRASATTQDAAAPGPTQAVNPTVAYEPTDWPIWPVAVVYVGALALLVICCLVLMLAYPDSLSDVDRTLTTRPVGPLLQTNPQADLHEFRATEEKRLHSYYWIDRSKGLVHIPIEQAMRKLAHAAPASPAKESP